MRPVFLNAAGIVTSYGVGLDSHRPLWCQDEPEQRLSGDLSDFKPAPFLSDRRMLKAVSDADALGLVAIEDLKKSFSTNLHEDSAKKGLYVGSPPASAFDNQYYFESMNAAAIAGTGSIREFGATCMQSKPTTLLIGLPNNVLCYGSIVLGVKGPNSNYTSTFLSGHIALINAARRVRRGQIDAAVAGGFSKHSEPVNSNMFAKLGVATSDPELSRSGGMAFIADGSVFLGLSAKKGRDPAADLSLEYIDGSIANDGAGPMEHDPYGHAFEKLINDLLNMNNVSKESVGLILANSSGFGQLDRCEDSVLSRVYANERVLPALGCSRKIFGNLMEAGGLIELCVVRDLYEMGRLPKQMQLTAGFSGSCRFANEIDSKRPFVLVLRASPWGEYSAVLVKTCRGIDERI